MIRPTRAWRTAAVLATASLALTACGSNSSDNASPATRAPRPSSSKLGAPAKGDGTLTVGTLLPQTGDLAFLGPPEFAGVQTAVDDINAAGGVLGKDVVQVKADSGDGTPDIAGAQTDKLLDANADVIVGAASSSVSLSVIDKITGAGVVQFSPANTSPALDDPKTDPKNLYFRTAPSDVLQGAVMANTVIEDGKNNVAILARQDSYGELLAGQIEKGIKAGGGNVATKQLYSADATNFTAEVNKVAATKPDAIVLVAFDETTKIIPPLIAKGVGPQDVQTYFVDGNTADYSKDFPKGTLKGVKATYPGAELTSDFKDRHAEDRPEAQGLHLRSRVVRRHGADRARGDRGQVGRPDDLRAGDHQGLRRTAPSARRSRSAPTCSRRARTSTTRVSPVRATWATPVARPRPPSASSSTTPTNTYKNLKYVTGVI